MAQVPVRLGLHSLFEKGLGQKLLSFCTNRGEVHPIWVYIEQDIEDALEAAIYGHGSPQEILVLANKAIDDKIKSEKFADQK